MGRIIYLNYDDWKLSNADDERDDDERALERWIECEACDGQGGVKDNDSNECDCPKCHGDGGWIGDDK